MPTTAALLTYVLVTLAITLVPGPTITYVVTRTLEGGRLIGLIAACGTTSGALIHAVAASVGLASLLASTPWALTGLQLAGAGYLVHLGVQQLRKPSAGPLDSSHIPAPARRLRVFIDGTVVDVLNPKTVLFFVALLPQFIDAGRGAPGTQLLAFALCYVLIVLAVNCSYAFVAAGISRSLSETPLVRTRINRGTGFVYFGVAAFAILV